jgi:hypothetical protein
LEREIFQPAGAPDARGTVQYSEYAIFSDKSLPHVIRWKWDGRFERELRLKSLSANAQASDSLFASPSGYDRWDACEHYRYAYLPTAAMPSSPEFKFKVADGFYIVVSPQGKAQEVRLINATGRGAIEWIDWIMKQQYRPATCDDRPVVGYTYIPFPQGL